MTPVFPKLSEFVPGVPHWSKTASVASLKIVGRLQADKVEVKAGWSLEFQGLELQTRL